MTRRTRLIGLACCSLLALSACSPEQLKALMGAAPAAKAGAKGDRSVSGKVLDTDGKPIAGAQVTIGIETATSGADGAYTVTGLPTGSLLTKVERGGYEPYYGNVSTDSSAPFDVHLKANSAIAGPMPSAAPTPKPSSSTKPTTSDTSSTPAAGATPWLPPTTSTSAPGTSTDTGLYAATVNPPAGTVMNDFALTVTLSASVDRPSFESAFGVYATDDLSTYYYAYRNAIAKNALVLGKDELNFAWTDATTDTGETVKITPKTGVYLPHWENNRYAARMTGTLTTAAGVSSSADYDLYGTKVFGSFFRNGTAGVASWAFSMVADKTQPQMTKLTVNRNVNGQDQLAITFSEQMRGTAHGLTFNESDLLDVSNYWGYSGSSSKGHPTKVSWEPEGKVVTLTYPAGTFDAGLQAKISTSYGFRDLAGNWIPSNDVVEVL